MIAESAITEMTIKEIIYKTKDAGLYDVVETIHDNKKLAFTLRALAKAPEYFWTIPASSTGKYHPKISQGEGGLLRHTIAAVKIALELFRAYPDLTKNQQDNIIIALILHDTIKKGWPEEKYTVSGHELLPRAYYKDLEPLIGSVIYNEIMDLISTHMGIWDKNQTPPEPEPEHRISPAEIVHLADYLSSRKIFEHLFCQGPQ